MKHPAVFKFCPWYTLIFIHMLRYGATPFSNLISYKENSFIYIHDHWLIKSQQDHKHWKWIPIVMKTYFILFLIVKRRDGNLWKFYKWLFYYYPSVLPSIFKFLINAVCVANIRWIVGLRSLSISQNEHHFFP